MLLCKHGVLKRLSDSADVDGAEAVCWLCWGTEEMNLPGQSEKVSMLQSRNFRYQFFFFLIPDIAVS
jgi:hypothetical protein